MQVLKTFFWEAVFYSYSVENVPYISLYYPFY